eukprot:Nk52_evm25s1178 gene=Nk52_evmTU25s1178
MQGGEEVPEELVYKVRQTTGLSFDVSKVAVSSVLKYIYGEMPELKDAISSHLCEVARSEIECVDQRDKQRLEVIFGELKYCKNDSEQRNWAVYDDSSIVEEYLVELSSLLESADRKLTCKMVRNDRYDIVQCLIAYYQMETRANLRILLLQIMGMLGTTLDRHIFSILLSSVIPIELARDIRQGNSSNNEADEMLTRKSMYAVVLASMVFSTGEKIPISHYNVWNSEFINDVMNRIESPSEEEEMYGFDDNALSLILSFNLHFQTIDFASDGVGVEETQSNFIPNNAILRALIKRISDRIPTTIFSEKLLLLANRGEDPVSLDSGESARDRSDSVGSLPSINGEISPQGTAAGLSTPPNSVLKFLIDCFGCSLTANLFFTNDLRVLIDIIIREVLNLGPKDRNRDMYLEILHRILINSSYKNDLHEHDLRYREMDIKDCLNKVIKEEDQYYGSSGVGSGDGMLSTEMSLKFKISRDKSMLILKSAFKF